MSIESEHRKALRRLIFWRFMGDLAGVPRAFFYFLAQCAGSFEKTVFCMELDAARRYRAITQIDLALAAGEVTRYSGLSAGAVEQRDAHFHPTSVDEDEDE